MAKLDKNARIIIKRITTPTLSATTAPNNDHTSTPAWSTTDVYTGEFLLNSVDEKLWIRTDSSIRRILMDNDPGGSGSAGTNGTSGTSGSSGTNGSSGSSGTNGSSGSSGLNGNSDLYRGTSLDTIDLSSLLTGTTTGITTTSGLSYSVLQNILISTTGKAIRGYVVLYTSLTGELTFYITEITGSGSASSWITNLDGAAGGDGSSGSSGTNGSSGSSGINGSSGNSGTNGTSGTSGAQGIDGSNLQFINNSGLKYTTLSAQTIYNTTMDSSLAVPIAVGGIPAGTTAGSLTGKTLVQIVDDLLFPTVQPTYTIPTITITNNTGTTQEVGRVISPTLTLTGIKNDAGSFTLLNILRNSVQIDTTSSPTITSQPDIASQFGYVDENNPNSGFTLVKNDTSFTIPVAVGENPSSTIYNGTGSYNSGVSKKTNKGIYDVRTPAVRSTAASQSSSTGFASNNITISGWYPYFYGKTSTGKVASDIVTIIQSGVGYTKVVASGAGTINMNFAAVGEWPWFAIFSGFTTKTIWYENALNSGIIGGLTDLFSAPTSLSIISPDSLWTATFKIYVAQSITTLGSTDIRVI